MLIQLTRCDSISLQMHSRVLIDWVQYVIMHMCRVVSLQLYQLHGLLSLINASYVCLALDFASFVLYSVFEM